MSLPEPSKMKMTAVRLLVLSGAVAAADLLNLAIAQDLAKR